MVNSLLLFLSQNYRGLFIFNNENHMDSSRSRSYRLQSNTDLNNWNDKNLDIPHLCSFRCTFVSFDHNGIDNQDSCMASRCMMKDKLNSHPSNKKSLRDDLNYVNLRVSPLYLLLPSRLSVPPLLMLLIYISYHFPIFSSLIYIIDN